MRDVVQMLKFVDANVMLGILISNSLPKTMKIHHIIIALIVGIVIGWLCRPNRVERVVDIQRDTLIYRDTVREYYPVEVTKETTNTIEVAVRDTIVKNDTLYVRLPLEKRVYKGEDYYAEVCGYDPRLTRLEVYPKTTSITNTERVKYHPKNRLSAGAEVHYFGTAYAPLYIEYERMLHKNVGIYGRFLYDVPNNIKGVGVGVEFTIGW